MRQTDPAFYQTREWKNCRAAYLKKVNGLCERCLADGLVVPAKFVHHKIYLNDQNVKDPRISLSFDNLEALCADHHNAEHFETKMKRWEFKSGELRTVGS